MNTKTGHFKLRGSGDSGAKRGIGTRILNCPLQQERQKVWRPLFGRLNFCEQKGQGSFHVHTFLVEQTHANGF